MSDLRLAAMKKIPYNFIRIYILIYFTNNPFG